MHWHFNRWLMWHCVLLYFLLFLNKYLNMKPIYYILLILFTPIIGSAQKTVFDLYPGRVSSAPSLLTKYKDKLFFYAKDSVLGGEIFVVDSATGGPSLLADINPGPASSYSIFDLNYEQGHTVTSHFSTFYYASMAVAYSERDNTDVLYFMANDGAHGFELYKYTGNAAPALEKEFTPGTSGVVDVINYDMDTVAGDVYVFFAKNTTDEIWRYDINGNTLKELNKSQYKDIYGITSYKGKLYFMARANIFPLRPTYAWCYDPVADTITKAFNAIDGEGNLQHLAGKLYFTSQDKTILFEYDGVNAPRIIDGNIYPYKIYVDDYGTFKGKLYYAGFNSNANEFDPITRTTKEVFKVDTSVFNRSYAYSFFEYRNKMYFNGTGDAANIHRHQLWEWDGVNPPQEIWRLTQSSIGGSPHNFHIVGDALYFVANASLDYREIGFELHKYMPQPASVNETLRNNNHFNLYPNPTSNNITIEVKLSESQALAFRVLSTDGRTVMELPNTLYSKGVSKVELNTSKLPSGTYFYQVTNYEHQQVGYGKFVKQ